MYCDCVHAGLHDACMAAESALCTVWHLHFALHDRSKSLRNSLEKSMCGTQIVLSAAALLHRVAGPAKFGTSLEALRADAKDRI